MRTKKEKKNKKIVLLRRARGGVSVLFTSQIRTLGMPMRGGFGTLSKIKGDLSLTREEIGYKFISCHAEFCLTWEKTRSPQELR